MQTDSTVGDIVGEDEIVVESSGPQEVREFYSQSRCLSCQRQNRRCHLGQQDSHCLQCKTTDECHFRRTVVREGPLNQFSWLELFGSRTATTTATATATTATIATGGRKRTFGAAMGVEFHQPAHDLSPSHSIGPSSMPSPADSKIGGVRPIQPRRLASYPDQNIHQPISPPTKRLQLQPPPSEDLRLPPFRQQNREIAPSPIDPFNRSRQLPRILAEEAREVERSSFTAEQDLSCERCALVFHSKSEYTKHMVRHEKPYLCTHQGCHRATSGFATQNDLDRHQRSVHNKLSMDDMVWKCFHPGCKSISKVWNRLDNFRAHVARMHKAAHADQLVKESERWFDTEERPRRQRELGDASPAARSHEQDSGGPDSKTPSEQDSDTEAKAKPTKDRAITALEEERQEEEKEGIGKEQKEEAEEEGEVEVQEEVG